MSRAAVEPEAELAPRLMTVEEYLDFEAAAVTRHEYVAGYVYAMAGGKQDYSVIAANVIALLHPQLRGRPCRVHTSDMAVRIDFQGKTRFYYPDCQVVCRAAPRGQSYQTAPVIVVEVSSESTRRFDQVEKWEGYLSLESLEVYILFEQEFMRAIVWRRGSTGFQRECLTGPGATISLPEIEATLALAEVYEAVEFPPKGDGSE